MSISWSSFAKATEDKRGSTTIENIIWLPILILVLAGIAQFGLIVNARNAVQAAAFEGARQASTSATPEETAADVVYDFAGGVLPGWRRDGLVRADVSMPEGQEPGAPVRVDVSYDVPVVFGGVIPGLGPDSDVRHVKGSAELAIEEKP